MVHAKTATIDGNWTTIGTANVDRLSMSGNYEINVEIIDASLAEEMERIFETDLTNALAADPRRVGGARRLQPVHRDDPASRCARCSEDRRRAPARVRRMDDASPHQDLLTSVTPRLGSPRDRCTSIGYFAEETTAEYVALGLHDRLAYFPSRAAAMGAVGPRVTEATFYVFAPWLHDAALPAAWDTVTPERMVQARRDGMTKALERILGAPDVAEAARPRSSAVRGADRPGPAAVRRARAARVARRTTCSRSGTRRRWCASTAATATWRS